ncbi:hypothetical protein PR048_029539 [Dryococelus australis]|uniref:Uncharacterized protein n=1 Tax=Dryococelus australis TaxID=614101 RepID=A0ABQ9GDP9_9NEOP|nr:hypothetical protein PR048_029539 [Dryococelus australis]
MERLKNVEDQVAVDARCHLFCQRNLFRSPSTGSKRGRTPCSDVDEAMEQIISYLEENSDECQFAMDDLIAKVEGDYIPDKRTIMSRLSQKYGDEVLIAENRRKKP